MVRYKQLGLQMAMHRKLKDLNQIDLAEKVGVSGKWISTIETGKEKPSQELAVKIAAALGKSIEEVFGDEYK